MTPSTYAPHVLVHLRPLPTDPDYGSLTDQILATANATRVRVAAGHGYNEQRPVVHTLTRTLHGSPAPSIALDAWRGDYALTHALGHVGGPEHHRRNLPGPVGVTIVATCLDGILLNRRSHRVSVRPGTISATVTEGITLDDLTPTTDDEHYLSILNVAQRGLREELGVDVPTTELTTTTVHRLGLGLGFTFGVLTHLPHTYQDLLKLRQQAPDSWEGDLIVAGHDEAVDLLTGPDANDAIAPVVLDALNLPAAAA